MNQSPSEKLLAHVDDCERCKRWFQPWHLCPVGDALLTKTAEETAAAIFPMPQQGAMA